MKFLLLAILLGFILSCTERPIGYEVSGTIVVDVDGNAYKTVKIGEQWWMAENLKVTHYRNGDPIPHVTIRSEWKDLESGAYCFYDNKQNNVLAYGLLYNWYAASDERKIAPSGWRVPTDDDWKDLEKTLGMPSSEYNEIGYRGSRQGGKLKETGNWHWEIPNIGANNETGFTARPAGYRGSHDGQFDGLGNRVYFWTTSPGDAYGAWIRKLTFGYSLIYRKAASLQNGFSIRCVKE